jgi:cation diffusion facilitator CzcD-associated flavoprotein CzcO
MPVDTNMQAEHGRGGAHALDPAEIIDRRTGLSDTVVEAVVVGGGVAGIRAVIALKQEGLQQIILLEKSDQLGGVWHHNRYPGVACDVPAPSYSYGFELNDWSRLFAEGAEIRDYFQRVAAENDVVRHVRFNTELLDAAWDDETSRWVCGTTTGRVRSRFLILATGVLHSEAIPDIPGAEKFAGEMFHSSAWPADFTPAGKRVAVVGTGASAIQFVPQIQPHVERLVVLQRTAPWLVPKPDVIHRRVDERRALRRQRMLRALTLSMFNMLMAVLMDARLTFLVEWMGRKHLRDSVSNPQLREALTPNYKFGCKRMLLSSDYYPAVSSNNVDYVASGLSEIRENSVTVSDGREFEVDTIIWATGFHFGLQVLDRVRDRNGETLGARFDGTPRTYKGITVVGCPNMFVLTGPNSGTASIPVAAEAQSKYMASAIRTMRRDRLETFEVRPDIEESWTREKDRRLRRAVWSLGGCKSYYLSDKGINVAAWPGSMANQVRELRTFDIESYVVTRQPEISQDVPAAWPRANEMA